jgi:hypothetical protein
MICNKTSSVPSTGGFIMKGSAWQFALGAGACLVVLAAPVLAAPVSGQERVVRSGNTEIIFEPANATDLPVDLYKAFGEFANDHPDLIDMLSRNPRLADNPRFLRKHTELAMFFNQHPDVKSHFLANPGNYVVPPR